MMSMKNVKEGASAPISEKSAGAKGKSATLPMMDIRPVPIDKICCTERIRTDEGDIEELSKNIGEFGLINPITVMEQEKGGYVLIAGYRRMKACAALGFNAIMATVLTAVAAEERLRLEISENVERKNFTVSEQIEYANKLRAVVQEEAVKRKAIHARDGYMKAENAKDMDDRPCPEDAYRGTTRDYIAKAVGFSSGRQYERLNYVSKKNPELMKKIDSGEMTITAAYDSTREQEKKKKEEESIPHQEKKMAMRAKNDITQSDKPESEGNDAENEQIVPVNECSPAQIGPMRPEDWKPLDVYYPAKDKSVGTGIKGAGHFKLMENHIYATLNQKYLEAVQSVNVMVASYSSAKSNMEMQIRSINSNLEAVIRERDELKEKMASMAAELEQVKRERTLFREERDEYRHVLEESRKEINRLQKKLGK